VTSCSRLIARIYYFYLNKLKVFKNGVNNDSESLEMVNIKDRLLAVYLLINNIALELGQIEAIKVHYLVPGRNKVFYKFTLTVGATINFGYGT